MQLFCLNFCFYLLAPLILVLSLVVYTPFVLCVRVFRPSKTMYWIRKCIAVYGRCTAYGALPWIKVGVQNMPDIKKGPYIFVENHTSSFDAFVQGFLRIELVQAARGWALKLPLLGFVAHIAGYIDVDALLGEKIIEKAVTHLKNGVSVVFYPEGTRHPENHLGPFHSTPFRVALKSGATLVPIVVKGISDKPGKGTLLMRPGRIQIQCLPPIPPEEYRNLTHTQLKKLVRQKMKEALFIK